MSTESSNLLVEPANADAVGNAPLSALACAHCGEPCPDRSFASDGRIFCCNGCKIVHELLTENGLGHFYDLNANPGVSMRKANRARQWDFLDEPALAQRLLDFTDGKQSRVTFHIPAIHCIACVWLLENLYRLNPGIGRSQVNFPKREVAVTFAPDKVKLSELVALLTSIGYEPSLTLGELEKTTPNPARKRLTLQIGLAGFAFGNVMLLSLPLYFGVDSFNGPQFRPLAGFLSLALALPVLIYSALDYWKSAWLSVRQRVLTLDVPIALGLVALYAQSAFEILGGRGHGYLDSLCGLIFFLLCGRAFQQKTHERLAFDLDYKSFFPLSVTRLDRGGTHAPPRASDRASRSEQRTPSRVATSRGGALGAVDEASTAAREARALPISTETRVALSQLRTGDRIVIRNGELIPADSRIVSGTALIDYSFVTGESEPVSKNEGDYLYAGGQQVGAAIELETLKPVSQSYLTSLWNHEAFQKNRDSDLHSLTNRYSRRFTFIVVAIAIGAGILWSASGDVARGIKAFTSVLIVACPCALALAAPFTLGTAQRLLARIHVFIKNALVLERMARVDAIVFDKTGTLTARANAVRFCGAKEPFTHWARGRPSDHQAEMATISKDETDRVLSPLPAGEGQGEGEPNDLRAIPVSQNDSQINRENLEAHEVSRFLPHPGPLPLGEGERKPALEQECATENQGKSECALTSSEARWIYSLARQSTHPHSIRIAEALSEHSAKPLSAFHEVPGCGIGGKVDGREVRLGSQKWFEELGIVAGQASRLSHASQKNGDRRDARDASPAGSTVHVAIDGHYRGAFLLSSPLRAEVENLVRNLGAQYELALLSGDNERQREEFRELFGSESWLNFNQTPLDKLNFIRRLQHSGRTVMMVGDGLNDAGALKQSDVGVAVVEKVGTFSPASDVILEAGRVSQLAEILKFARRATRIVRAGFVISALYNVVGVSIAAAGILSPMICAVLMPLSSISVVLFACGAAALAAKQINPKAEFRNPKEIRNSKSESGTAESIRNSDFGLPSGFGFRISDFQKP